MNNKLMVCYKLVKVKEGFVSRCITNEKVTAFGTTKEKAGDNLIKSIQEYLEIYPDRQAEIFNTPMKEFPQK